MTLVIIKVCTKYALISGTVHRLW